MIIPVIETAIKMGAPVGGLKKCQILQLFLQISHLKIHLKDFSCFQSHLMLLMSKWFDYQLVIRPLVYLITSM